MERRPSRGVAAARPGRPPAAPPRPPILAHVTDKNLLAYGVPTEWLDDVRAATDDTLFALVDHLPAEAMEALLALATGEVPQLPLHTPEGTDPFAHPDAQRRFRVMANAEELERALDYPWEKWTVFLHPAQRAIVERRYNGPARVAGSAGTGKTVVALHRAVHLARTQPGRPRAPHDLQRHAGERASRQARAAGRRRAQGCTSGSTSEP